MGKGMNELYKLAKKLNAKAITCGLCQGNGYWRTISEDEGFAKKRNTPCLGCEGTGSVIETKIGWLAAAHLTFSEAEHFLKTGRCKTCIKCYEYVKEKECFYKTKDTRCNREGEQWRNQMQEK